MGNVEYVRPTWKRFESWVDRNYEWDEARMDGVGERVISLQLPVDTKEIRIFTTVDKPWSSCPECGWDQPESGMLLKLCPRCTEEIPTGDGSGQEGRDKGDDAIRTVIWDTEFDVPVGGREYTKRIRTSDDPIRYLRNMHEKVVWLYNNWHAFDHSMRCPDCDGILRGAESEYGEYLFCKSCDYTEDLPDKSCSDCQSGMKLVEDGPHGDYFFCLNEECDHTEDA